MADEWQTYSRALRRLLANPGMRDRFALSESRAEVAADLDVSREMADELQNLLIALPSAGEHAAMNHSELNGASAMEDKAKAAGQSAEAYLEQSLKQLRTGSRILMGMSLALFAIGLGFLLLAGIRSLTHPESVEITAVVGGLGIVQIVAVFYRNPVRDIGRVISNAQQAQMIVLTYMLGVGLVGQGMTGKATGEQQEALSKLTNEALERLERFTEHQPATKTAAASSAGS
jgi:hypothetical protein